MFLKMLAHVQIGYPFRGRVVQQANGNVVVIQLKDIGDDGRLDLNDSVRVALPDLGQHHLLRRGDILLRSRGKTNVVAIFDREAERAVLAAPLILIRPQVNVWPAYLAWFFNSPTTQASLARLAIGTSQQIINAEAVKQLDVPLPSMEQQKAIAEIGALAREEGQLSTELLARRRHLIEARLLRAARNPQLSPG